MEDYKEKYEMALETVQEILSSGSDSIKISRLKLRLQPVFPELAESEEEKIRKAIISGLKYLETELGWDAVGNVDILDAYAWLEKQGEQKPFDYENATIVQKDFAPKQCEKPVNDTDEEIVEAVQNTSVLDMVSDAHHVYELANSNGLNIADEYAGLTDFERTLADVCIGWIGKELGWKQYIKDNADVLLKIAIKKFNSVQDAPFKQKSAWGEEDDNKVKEIIEYLNELYDHYRFELQELNDYKNWLKSLRQRIGG